MYRYIKTNDDICDAYRKLITQVQNGRLSVEDCDKQEQLINKFECKLNGIYPLREKNKASGHP